MVSLHPLRIELHVVVSTVWVLRIKPGSPGRANVLYCGAISPFLVLLLERFGTDVGPAQDHLTPLCG